MTGVYYGCEPNGQWPPKNKYVELTCSDNYNVISTYYLEEAFNFQIPHGWTVNKCCGFFTNKAVNFEVNEVNDINKLSFIISTISLVISLIITIIYVINCCKKRSEDRTIKTIMQRAQVHRNVANLNNLSNV
jgi:hypothetical protein